MTKGRSQTLILEHMPGGHPGLFLDLMQADGIACREVRLDRGEPIPDLAAYDALIVMGGPMDVWQEPEHPWLRDEEAIQVGKRALGLQFHAEATGSLLDEWLAQPANVEALVRRLGPGGAERFRAGARAHMAAFEAVARRIYDRFRRLL